MNSQKQSMASFYNLYEGVKYVVIGIFLFYAVDSF